MRACSRVPLQNQVKGALKSNWPRIVIGFFEVSLYCALYHHATEEIKKRTKHRRWAAPSSSACMQPACGVLTGSSDLCACCRRLHRALSYTFDIVLPAPIYAPIFGFLVRLALPI